MIEFLANFGWMSLAGVLPVIFFAIDDVHDEENKLEAFAAFVYSTRFVTAVSLTFYAVCSIFATKFGFDVLTSLTLFAPFPAFTSFGIGIGVGIAAMKMDGE